MHNKGVTTPATSTTPQTNALVLLLDVAVLTHAFLLFRQSLGQYGPNAEPLPSDHPSRQGVTRTPPPPPFFYEQFLLVLWRISVRIGG